MKMPELWNFHSGCFSSTVTCMPCWASAMVVEHPAMPPPTNQMEISCALMPSSIAAITMTATQIMVSKIIPPFSKRKPHTRARPVQAPALPILIISDFHKICKRFSSPEKYFTQIIKYRARFCRARLQYSYRFTCSMLSFTRSPSPVFCTETSI